MDGKIDVIYTSSLGCISSLWTANLGQVKVGHIILDGTVDMSLGVFKKPAAMLAGWLGEQIITGKMDWYLKLEDVTPATLQTFLYPNVSRNTLKNAFYDAAAMFTRISKLEPNQAVRVACWSGSEEKLAAKEASKIRQAFPNGRDTTFEDFGHGEILRHPERFHQELQRFLAW